MYFELVSRGDHSLPLVPSYQFCTAFSVTVF